MDAKDLIAELRSLIEGARSMPMSASAVVNRTQALDLIGRLEATFPAPRGGGDGPRSGGNGSRLESHHEPDPLLAETRRDHDRLLTESEVFRVAKVEADRERLAASREAAELRRQADDYVDTRLATFEITLTRTLEAVARGRARLQGRSHFDALTEDATGPTDDSRALDDRNDGGLTTPDELRPTAPDQGR